MAVAQIIQFGVESGTSSKSVDTAIQMAIESIKNDNAIEHVVIGTKLDNHCIQITSQYSTLPSDTATSTLLTTLSHLGAPTSILHANLSPTVFPGPASAPVAEYVLSSFSSSTVTPAFKQQIEADFARFEALFSAEPITGTSPDMLATGWTEDHDNAEVEGGKSIDFCVVRGWDSVEAFQEMVKKERVKEALGILFGWGAPFKLWHVERKAQI